MSREARLKPECAALYPGLCCGRWDPAAVVIERLIANLLLRGQATLNTIEAMRRLNPHHFDFRDGVAPTAQPDVTDAAQDRRKPNNMRSTSMRDGASRREGIRSRAGERQRRG